MLILLNLMYNIDLFLFNHIFLQWINVQNVTITQNASWENVNVVQDMLEMVTLVNEVCIFRSK